MARLVFEIDKVAAYVNCADCPKEKRPIKADKAIFVSSWLTVESPPTRVAYCRKHYNAYCSRQISLPLVVPCSNTGVTPR